MKHIESRWVVVWLNDVSWASCLAPVAVQGGNLPKLVFATRTSTATRPAPVSMVLPRRVLLSDIVTNI